MRLVLVWSFLYFLYECIYRCPWLIRGSGPSFRCLELQLCWWCFGRCLFFHETTINICFLIPSSPMFCHWCLFFVTT